MKPTVLYLTGPTARRVSNESDNTVTKPSSSVRQCGRRRCNMSRAGAVVEAEASDGP